MGDIAVRVENLSKKYRLGALQDRHDTLRDHLSHIAKKMIQWGPRPSRKSDIIWALKNVSFEVRKGEVLGIIGRNGTGKSTLLKLLARITEPTEGYAEIHGRIGSLLEVGTGFHPELTGRENIYLNGAILGMGRAEIRKKFDEIVAFAEVERFLDTPVKRYSSGMYVRLAFAVAAHLEPEILIVDEVLAVGDAQFQNKCVKKMDAVGKEGRTVLFVSHNMNAVKQLCDKAILLASGTKIEDDAASVVVEKYLNSCPGSDEGSSYVCLKANKKAWIASAVLKSVESQNTGRFLMSAPINVECALNIAEPSKFTLSIQIKEMDDSPIFHFPNGDESFNIPSSRGQHTVTVHIPPLNLYPGKYRMTLSLCEIDGQGFKIIDVVESITFETEQDYLLCHRPLGRHAGLVFSHAEWSSTKLNVARKNL